MKLLLDTCAFLWAVSNPSRLSEACRHAIVDPANEVFLSVISAWEMNIKYKLHSLALAEPPDRFIPRCRALHGIETLPLDEEVTLQLSRLPDHHKDPFDRMLICQAIVHGMAILTPDDCITRYPVRTIW